MKIETDKEQLASELRGSLLLFIRFFFKHLTGKDFIVSQPIGRESHHIIVCRAYTDLFRNQRPSYGLMLNLPPGYGKSLISSMWVAWCYAHYADCNFLYVSYSHDLASKHTAFIKMVMSCAEYKYLFDVHIRQDSRAKDHFVTTANGTTAAFGSSGSITGRDGGAPGQSRFTGCVLIDDPIKPDAANSDTVRASVIKNYQETIMQRPRDTRVPIVFIGQRLHEDDLAAYLLSGKDVREWNQIVLKAIDAAGNALYPEVQTKDYLLELQSKQQYVFASQMQQDPIPSGGAIFKPEWFVYLDEEPKVLFSFLTCDTAETDKDYNDSSVFSFWGCYEVINFGQPTGVMALHWIDCLEIRVEPKDLKGVFLDFYADCCRYKVPPLVAAIEKKSTGVTLVSTLKELRGMTIREIERSRASGSKTQRFLNTQPYIASKLISFTKDARHAEMCITHLSKITANQTHRFDDIADTLTDAVKLALIDKVLYSLDTREKDTNSVVKELGASFNRRLQAGIARDGRFGEKTYR